MSTASIGRAREWVAIPGLHGYDVSNDGTVRSWRPWRGKPLPREVTAYLYDFGYLYVQIRDADNKKANMLVHRLVALAFHGQPEEGQVVRHLDGNKLNNTPENLAYGSRSENAQDAIEHGQHFPSYLTHCVKGGHPLSGDNLYVAPGSGKRQCRACHADWKRRSR